MATRTTIDQLLDRNSSIAKSHKPVSFFSEFPGLGLELPRTLIITCIDPRCSPDYYVNLKPEDLVLVMRNVCGHVAPALNDIIALDRLLTLREIMIVHHTDCGALLWRDEDVRADLKKAAPDAENIDSMSFGGITDIEQSVKDDFAILASSPFVRKELIAHTFGFVYNIKSGKLAPVQLQI